MRPGVPLMRWSYERYEENDSFPILLYRKSDAIQNHVCRQQF
jgi:hypothetical protein